MAVFATFIIYYSQIGVFEMATASLKIDQLLKPKVLIASVVTTFVAIVALKTIARRFLPDLDKLLENGV